MLVVPSLIQRKCLVTLHSDQDQVSRSSEDRPNASSDERGVDLLESRQVLASIYIILEMITQGKEYSQTGRSVDGLSHQGRVNPKGLS